MKRLKLFPLGFAILVFSFADCKKSNPPGPVDPGDTTTSITGASLESWLTKADQSALLAKQTATIQFKNVSQAGLLITVDSATQYQPVEGFGYTLTGGSAALINNLPATNKAALLQELFGAAQNSIGISYLRVSIGASDLSAEVFTYDDMPAGQTDPQLQHFSLSKDTVDLIPLLQQILTINPNIKILGSPWTAPVWMKDNGSSIGGKLRPEYYSVYANYFVKYVQAMAAKGITIDAVTLQNEPENPNNNPSMVMTSADQANFIKNNLGPAFQSAGINTKIITFDHNCDHPNYPIEILNDGAAKPYVYGSAFHLYAGDISALSTVHAAHPDKALYFTEQWTGAAGNFNGDLQWHIKNVVIGSMRNWSRTALEWNLANDPAYGPHTPGGCTECKGALTISGTSITRNVAYYIIAHASKFVPAGSKRILSNNPGLPNVAFVRPDGKKALIVLNEGANDQAFSIKYKNLIAVTTIPSNSVITYTW